jgi:hypothetical protein
MRRLVEQLRILERVPIGLAKGTRRLLTVGRSRSVSGGLRTDPILAAPISALSGSLRRASQMLAQTTSRNAAR